MTDRELLELAAKAAGISIMWREDWNDMPALATINGYTWNPLTDDGDALWLAVKCGICFGPNFDGNMAVAFGSDGRNITEDFGIGKFSATRRAIVRAAAELGKAIP